VLGFVTLIAHDSFNVIPRAEIRRVELMRISHAQEKSCLRWWLKDGAAFFIDIYGDNKSAKAIYNDLIAGSADVTWKHEGTTWKANV
jgi:hypothetical protein